MRGQQPPAGGSARGRRRAGRRSNGDVDRSSERTTTTDRIRRRFADNPVGAALILVVAGLAGVGGAVSGVQGVADLFRDQGVRQVAETPPAGAGASSSGTTDGLSTSELRNVDNWRYGFSVDVPVTWTRNDPINGDGVSALGPEDGLELAAYGRLAARADLQDRLEMMEQVWVQRPDGHVLEGPTAQNVGLRLANGTMAEIQGSRLLVAQDASGTLPDIVTVVLLVPAEGRDVEMTCQLPADQAEVYRPVCNQLTASLTIVGAWSQ